MPVDTLFFRPSADEAALLKSVRRTRLRPGSRDARWYLFTQLLDYGLVEDLGGDYAKLTEAGRYVLKKGSRDDG